MRNCWRATDRDVKSLNTPWPARPASWCQLNPRTDATYAPGQNGPLCYRLAQRCCHTKPKVTQKICGFCWIQVTAEGHLGPWCHQDEKQTQEECRKGCQLLKKELCPDIKQKYRNVQIATFPQKTLLWAGELLRPEDHLSSKFFTCHDTRCFPGRNSAKTTEITQVGIVRTMTTDYQTRAMCRVLETYLHPEKRQNAYTA